MRNATAFGRDYEKNQKLSKTAPETPIAHVGAEPIALSYFLNVYGPVPNDVNWNDIKKSRVRLLAEVFLLSSEYDRLGFARPDVEDEFTMLETFHLFAVQAARDLGGKVLGQPPDDSFVLLKQLCEFQNLPRVRNAFVDATAETAPWIDRELLDATEWVVEKHGD
ncbi:MAG: hypothetical protein M5R36_23145 [Deltaproteobacteria bacterium]|nr:hypothetical protein [Deltaproteobacteria bacterium]